MIDTESTPMITPSEVIEHIYCPRFTYFMNVLMIPQYEDRRYKVLKGREVHRQRETRNQAYLRKKIGVVEREIAVYLASSTLRVRGIVDEVLTLKDGTMSVLDYKYTAYREQAFKTHRIQTILYGLLVREIYERMVTRAYVAYIKDGSRVVEVPIDGEAESLAMTAVGEIFDILSTGRMPKRTSNTKKCGDCCYRNICV